MANILTPLDKLYHWEKTKGDAVWIRQPIDGKWHTFTWKQAGQEIRRMAAAIKAMNLPPKSHIGLVSKNCAHWLITDLAIMMSGHISIPLYPNIGADTIQYVLEHSGAKLLFVGKLDNWDGMKGGVPSDVECISFPLYGPSGYKEWESITAKHEPMQESPTRDLDDLMTIIYTSGTTGKPKGVMHTFGSVCFAIDNALTEINPGENGRFFSYLPLSHIAERMLVEMGSIYTGSETYFAESLDKFADNLRTASPTVFLGVPRIWTKFQMGILKKMPQKKMDRLLGIPLLGTFIKRKIRKGLGLDNVVHAITGAAPTPVSLIKWFEKLGIYIQEAYGMTENSAYSHFTRKGKIKYGSTGQAMPKADVVISDIGEILVKSNANMKGYFKAPDLTEAAFDGEYLRTGDKGKIDSQGYLTITGRVKDLFKTEKGKYVAPVPIELGLCENRNIEQVCVVGTLLPQPIALIVLSEDARTKDQSEIAESLKATLESRNKVLEKHERLKKAIIVKDPWSVENSLLTPTLKIKRGSIEDKYGNQYTSWYDKSDTVVWE